MLEEIPCRICGKMFTPINSYNVCCSQECTKENNRRMSKEAKKRRVKDGEYQKPKLKESKKKPHEPSIEEIQALAEAAHMTYGQYVAMEYMRGRSDAGKS